MQLPASILRVACDVTNPNSFNNAVTNQAAVIPRAGSVQVACALFIGSPSAAANLVSDLSNIVTANLVIRAGTSPTGTVLVESVLPAAALNAALTYSQWTDGTAAHFTFALSPTDTNQTAGNVFIGIGVTTTNAGDVSCAFSSTAQIVDRGIFNPGPPTAADYTSWSKLESDGRYAFAGSSANVQGNITGTTGGGASNLDGLATLALPTYYGVTIREAGQKYTFWVLEPDTEDATGTRSVQPLDHDATTNPRSFRQRS